MNLNDKQTRYAGIALIVLGIVAVFNLWSLIPVALLAGGGYVIYRRQRAIGRGGEAVQALLWGVGLAVLLLLDFILPGVLLLGGASLLLRGHEGEAERRVEALTAKLTSRRSPQASAQPTRVTIVDEQTASNETVRLR